MLNVPSPMYDYFRFAAAAPFSRTYRGRLRWLLDTQKWEDRGIAASDIRRKALVAPDTGAVFIAVSRAANTSLSFILSRKPGAHARNVHRKRFSPERLVDTGKTLSDLAEGSRPIFTFVRHPVSRFWSAYSGIVTNARRRRGLRERIAACVGKSPSATLSPEDMIAYLSNTPTLRVDEHVRPQWSCTGIEYLPITFVGKIETIGTDIDELIARGLLSRESAQRLPHFNASKPQEPDNKVEIDRVVRKIYRKDLELFGYD